MEANATLRGARTSSNAVLLLVLGLIAAFLLGGAGGFVIRGASSTSPVTTTHSASQLNGSPAPASTAEPYRYPRAK